LPGGLRPLLLLLLPTGGLVRLMAADHAPGSCSDYAMVASEMPGGAANSRAFQTSFGVRCARANCKTRGEDDDR
jgi:hypothetical protein